MNAPAPINGQATAVTYLRVSTTEQAEKGGESEGYSIPAQREANNKKAEQLDAVVVAEFVDAGESARKADRPALLQMLQYVAQHRVDYCIVHKIDRLARNRADDITIHLALQQAGVQLVSTSENNDETPSGMLLHGIMSSIAEFYSRNLATESIKGMTQKAKTGGTPTKAPLGYLNIGVFDDVGREVRTVQIDPARGPLIAWAFKAFASGNWTLSQMREELIRRGLTSKPTPKRPARPISKTCMHRILTNPYYKGTIVFRGDTYKGNHEPLIPPEVFYRVQQVLQSHKSATDRTQVHDHYLKGLVYCGKCGSRLIIVHARSRTKMIYPYFVCSGRQYKKTDCQFQAIRIEDVEDLVAAEYGKLVIPAAQRAQIRDLVNARYDKLMAEAKPEFEALAVKRKEIEDKQDRLLDSHLKGNLDLDVMSRKQRDLAEQLQQVKADIAIVSTDYASNRAYLDDALSLIAEPARLYETSDADTKRLANQTFFRRIWVEELPNSSSCDGLDHARTIRIQLEPPYSVFHDPELIKDAEEFSLVTAKSTRKSKKPAVHGAAGSILSQMGWLTGFEPATAWTTTRSSAS